MWKQSNKAYYIYNIPCTYLLILIHGTILLHLCSPGSHSYTQISQSFTPPSIEIPSVLSSFTLHEGVLFIHIAVSFSIMVSGCHFPFKTAKPPTESRTWVKLLDLSGTRLWDHLLCLPSTAGPDCPASKRNTVKRGNPAPQWTMVESPGAPLCLHLALPLADCTRRSLPGSGVSLAQKAQSAGNLELKVSSSLSTRKENREV